MEATVPAATGPRSTAVTGILLFVGAIACFAVMDAMIKALSAGYGTWQIIFFRALFALLPIAVLVGRSGGVASLRTRNLMGHVLRALVGVAAVFLFFRSFALMPLADAYAIGFAAPLFLTALSGPILKERVGWRRWVAVLVGFTGVVVMLRPGAGVFSAVSLIPLGGALFYALTMLYVRYLSRTETNAAITFYFMATLGLVAAVLMLPDWRWPAAGVDWLLLAATGVVGGVAQILLTQAFRTAAPAVLAPFEYTGMVWAVVFGYVLFGDVPGWWIWLGSAIVIASGLYIIHREGTRGPDTDHQP